MQATLDNMMKKYKKFEKIDKKIGEEKSAKKKIDIHHLFLYFRHPLLRGSLLDT